MVLGQHQREREIAPRKVATELGVSVFILPEVDRWGRALLGHTSRCLAQSTHMHCRALLYGWEEAAVGGARGG